MYALWSVNYKLIQVPVRTAVVDTFNFCCETTSVCVMALGKAVSQIPNRACYDGKTQSCKHVFKVFFLKHIQCSVFSFCWSFDCDFSLSLLFRLNSLSWSIGKMPLGLCTDLWCDSGHVTIFCCKPVKKSNQFLEDFERFLYSQTCINFKITFSRPL